MKTKITKILALLLCIAMFSTIPVITTGAETTVDKDGETYTLIHNEDELKAIASDLSGKYMLANDITLHDANGASNWTPILKFAGVLDGNGYAINNFTLVDAAKTSWATTGLFGTTNGATIKNLTINGTVTNNIKQSIQIAAFVGVPNDTQIMNCVSNVDFTFGTNSSTIYAGPFAGFATNTTFENCVNNGSVDVQVTNLNCHIGGICGYTAKGQRLIIRNCVNKGDITSFMGNVGGILGWANYQNDNTTVSIIGCANHGNLTGAGYSGGIFGRNQAYKTEIIDCINTANVTGSTVAGGILGASATATVCDSVTISNCQVFSMTGEPISITATSNHAAGIYAYHGSTDHSVAIDNCVNFADVRAADNYAAGILAWTNRSNTKAITITQCANMGNINTDFAGEVFLAGIVGRVLTTKTADSYVSNCYNRGTVTAPNKTSGFIGGIAGSEAKIAYTNCFTEAFDTATGDTIFGYGKAAIRNNCAVITEESDLNELVDTLNGTESPALTFRINNDKIEPIYQLTAEPVTFVGTQLTKVGANGTYSVRFVSVVNSLKYDTAGYLLSAVITTNGNVITVPVTDYRLNNVYASLQEYTEGEGIHALTNPFGTYYLAQGIAKIPANADITFTVTPYTVTDGVVNQAKTCQVTVTGGTLVQSTWLAD